MPTYINRVRVHKVDLLSMYSNEKIYVLIINNLLYKNIFTMTVSSEAVDDVAVRVFEGSLCSCKFTASPCDVEVTDNHNINNNNIIAISLGIILLYPGVKTWVLEAGSNIRVYRLTQCINVAAIVISLCKRHRNRWDRGRENREVLGRPPFYISPPFSLPHLHLTCNLTVVSTTVPCEDSKCSNGKNNVHSTFLWCLWCWVVHPYHVNLSIIKSLTI